MSNVIRFPEREDDEAVFRSLVDLFTSDGLTAMEKLNVAAERWPKLKRGIFEKAIAEAEAFHRGRVEKMQAENASLIEEARASFGDDAADQLAAMLQ